MSETLCNDALYMPLGGMEHVLRCTLPQGHRGTHATHGNGFNQHWAITWESVDGAEEKPTHPKGYAAESFSILRTMSRE